MIVISLFHYLKNLQKIDHNIIINITVLYNCLKYIII